MSRQRWNLSEGKALVEQWQQSGLDKKSFCDMHHITYSRFLYWNKLVNQSMAKAGGKSGFVSLIIDPEASSETICLKGRNGLALYVSTSPASIQFVKTLLSC